MAEAIPVKITFLSTVRRFSIESNCSFVSFLAQLHALLPTTPQTFHLNYLDEDGDSVTLSSAEEWNELLRLVTTGKISLLRLFIHDGVHTIPDSLRPQDHNNQSSLNNSTEHMILPGLSRFLISLGNMVDVVNNIADNTTAQLVARAISDASIQAAEMLRSASPVFRSRNIPHMMPNPSLTTPPLTPPPFLHHPPPFPQPPFLPTFPSLENFPFFANAPSSHRRPRTKRRPRRQSTDENPDKPARH